MKKVRYKKSQFFQPTPIKLLLGISILFLLSLFALINTFFFTCPVSRLTVPLPSADPIKEIVISALGVLLYPCAVVPQYVTQGDLLALFMLLVISYIASCTLVRFTDKKTGNW